MPSPNDTSLSSIPGSHGGSAKPPVSPSTAPPLVRCESSQKLLVGDLLEASVKSGAPPTALPPEGSPGGTASVHMVKLIDPPPEAGLSDDDDDDDDETSREEVPSTLYSNPGLSSPEQATLSSAALCSPTDDVLKMHRVKKFTSPHLLDRSNVVPELEERFIRLVSNGRCDDALDLMREHVTSGRLLLTCNALSAAVGLGNYRLVKAMILYPMVDFSTKARAPVYEAVVRGDTRLVKLLLLGPLTDVNKSCPLARAVLDGSIEMVKALTSSERINPNKGGPLYHAVDRGDLEMVTTLLAHRRLNVNKFSGGVGSTALCRAIVRCNEPIIDCLLEHPKIDINRGFLLTPLQQAVDTQNPAIVEKILTASTLHELDPNKHMGGTPHPLHLALEAEIPNMGVLRLLLRNHRTKVDSDFVERIEREGRTDIEELMVECGRPIPFSVYWLRRLVSVSVDVTLVTFAHIMLGLLVYELLLQSCTAQVAAIIAVMTVANVATTVLLHRQSVPFPHLLFLRPLPMIFDILLFHHSYRPFRSTRQPAKRRLCYKAMEANMLCQGGLHFAPQLLLILSFQVFSPPHIPKFFVWMAVVGCLLVTAKGIGPPVVRRCSTKDERESMKKAFIPPSSTSSDTTRHGYAVELAFQTRPDASDACTSPEEDTAFDFSRSESKRIRRRPPELDMSLVPNNNIVVPPRVKEKERLLLERRQR
eukprot:Sspe_Gene.117412::Locus_108559_Transcript_1_1_Confidence_1.000_Length_2332::g.117412::m.117412